MMSVLEEKELTHGKAPILVVSRDGSLLEIITRVCGTDNVEVRFDVRTARDFASGSKVRVIVVDDEALVESERGWFLDQIHRRASDALVVYLASYHTPEVEKRARCSGVLYYTARPIDEERLTQVLRALKNN